MKNIFLKKDSYLLTVMVLLLFSQAGVSAQNNKLFLGVKLDTEIQTIIEEIESKTKRKIYAEYVEFEDEYLLGSSYISSSGVPILRVNINMMNQPPKVAAIIAHELLHLRLRANNYPVFLFDPRVKTGRGAAQDTEQSNVNDLASLIEHRAFKTEMEKFGLNKLINLAGDTERAAEKRAGKVDGPSDAINFARALLEYQTAADVEKLRKIYAANNWQRSLKTGQQIADIIKRSQLNSPSATTSAFLLSLSKLYPAPRPFRLKPDKTVGAYRQLLIGF